MNWDRISATTTYVMWREERVLNVGVLQIVRLSNLVVVIVDNRDSTLSLSTTASFQTFPIHYSLIL
jgi:hypothetical protein